jgi:hypothetical protein
LKSDKFTWKNRNKNHPTWGEKNRNNKGALNKVEGIKKGGKI